MYLLWENFHIGYILCVMTSKMVESVDVDDFLVEYMKFNQSLEGLSTKLADMENTIVNFANIMEENWSKYDRVLQW